VTSINEKLGLRPAGKRAMMKLPKDRARAVALTAATCPKCGQRGVRELTLHGQLKWCCSWCAHSWMPSVDVND
jgi:hypothetical protein